MSPYTVSERLNQIMAEKGLRQVDVLKLCRPLCLLRNVKLQKSDLSQKVYKSQQQVYKEVYICMLAQWLGDFVGHMHRYRVSVTRLAKEMGVTREYLSAILNGHREPAGIQDRLQAALDNIVKRGD